MKGIPERLKEVRKSMNMTQRELAEKLGVSHTHISELEVGRKRPSELFLSAVEARLGVRKEWLSQETGEKYVEERILFTEEEVEIIKALREMPEESKKIFLALIEKLQ